MRQRPWIGAPHLVDDLAAAPGSMVPYGHPHPGVAPYPFQNAGYGAAAYGGSQVPFRRIMPTVPGAPALGFRDQAVGLGTVQFTATSGTTLQLSGSPGRPFKGRRLILDTTRVGATSTGLLTVTTFLIGDVNQLVGRGALLVSAYAPTAFGSDGQYSACAPALSIVLGVTTSLAPTAPDTITVGGQINGETIGS